MPAPQPGTVPATCKSDGQAWMALVQKDANKLLSPVLLVPKNEQPIQVQQLSRAGLSSLWADNTFTTDFQSTTAAISGDQETREHLLRQVTFPPGPAAPPRGGLALPKRFVEAMTEAPPSNGMVLAMDATTMNTIRTKLTALRDPVPAGRECALRRPDPSKADPGAGPDGTGSVGINLRDGIVVVLGDASCPQAISSAGGRVKAPAGLGAELRDLIVESDRTRSLPKK